MFTSSNQDRSFVNHSQNKILRGLPAIAEFMGISSNTLRKYHNKYDLPMRKIGGNWESSTSEIDAWKTKTKID